MKPGDRVRNWVTEATGTIVEVRDDEDGEEIALVQYDGGDDSWSYTGHLDPVAENP